MKKFIFLLLILLLPVLIIISFAGAEMLTVNKTIVIFPNNSTTNSTINGNQTINSSDISDLNSGLDPLGDVIKDNPLNIYYLIPIIMTAVMILILIILIVIARLLDLNRKKHRVKPIIGLQQT